jgi:hypothetical protein
VSRRLAGALLILAMVPARPALAWTSTLMESLARDARKLLPRSLAELLAEREKQVLEESWQFPPDLAQALAADLGTGRLQAQTLNSAGTRAKEVADLFRKRRVSDGVVHLGGLLRIPADLSDPVLSAGAEGYPAGVTREYYAFVEGNLDKIPIVLDDERALKLERARLPEYWQRLLDKSRSDSAVIRTELFRNGRVVDHRAIDYRSPVFGVASLSYSRAVTAIAATWLAVWREVRGDLTRMPVPKEVRPEEGRKPPPPGPAPSPGPRAAGSMKEPRS